MSEFDSGLTPEEQERVERDEQEAKRRRARELKDIKAVMGTIEGRRVVWSILDSAGIFKTSFTGETNSTIFNEGQRNGGLRLFSDIMESCPDLYLNMADEAKEPKE
jgi:hypothetical protein